MFAPLPPTQRQHPRLHTNDDRAMLMQSHREGLYVWDDAEGEDRNGSHHAAAGLGGGEQGGGPEAPGVAAGDLAAHDGAAAARSILHPQHQSHHEQQQQHGDAPAPEAAEAPLWIELAPPSDDPLPGSGIGIASPAPAATTSGAPDLRMVAYLHYEQLLPAVQGHLPLPQVRNTTEVCMVMTNLVK